MAKRISVGMCLLAACWTLAACSASATGGADGTTTRVTSSTTTPTTAGTSTTTSTSPTTIPPPATTTTTPPPRSPTWEQIKGAAIPGLCSHQPTTLVEGKDVTLGEYQGYLELLPTLSNGQTGLIPDVPSNDAGPLTAVVMSCNTGGVAWPNSVLFFSDGGSYYGQTDLYEGVDWAGAGMNAPGREGVIRLSLEGDQLSISTSAETGSDPSCCPSTEATVVVHAADRAIVIDDVFEDLGD